MLFVEFRFLAFFAFFFLAYWALSNNSHRKLLILIGSYVFYASWDYRFLTLIWISTIVDYFAALQIEKSSNRKQKRLWLVLSLCINLGILGTFKYFDFFAESLVDLFGTLGIPVNYTTINIVLPVGISFYTFQTLSYTIDVYRGELRARRNFLDIAVFVAFFPQLVAGPILRARQFLPQLDRAQSLAGVALKSCLVLFAIGFFKKAVVSDNLAPFVDMVFADPSLYTAYSICGAVLFGVIQFYCDFSGYSDMAVATAGLLGFQIPQNFDAPYLAPNIAQLWRRWHITLTNWMHDYLFLPLCRNRLLRYPIVINLIITMTVVGLWHGAAWTFVFWGFLQGVALVVHRYWQKYWRANKNGKWKLPSAVGVAITFYWWCVTGIFFRASDFDTGVEIANTWLTFRATGNQVLGVDPLPIFVGLTLLHVLFRKVDFLDLSERIPNLIFAPALGVISAACVFLVPLEYRPFIYFQF